MCHTEVSYRPCAYCADHDCMGIYKATTAWLTGHRHAVLADPWHYSQKKDALPESLGPADLGHLGAVSWGSPAQALQVQQG